MVLGSSQEMILVQIGRKVCQPVKRLGSVSLKSLHSGKHSAEDAAQVGSLWSPQLEAGRSWDLGRL